MKCFNALPDCSTSRTAFAACAREGWRLGLPPESERCAVGIRIPRLIQPGFLEITLAEATILQQLRHLSDEQSLVHDAFDDDVQHKLRVIVSLPQIAIQDIDSINPFASRKSAVSKPSVNHSKIGISNSGARDSLAWECQSFVRLMAARNSQDFALWSRAT